MEGLKLEVDENFGGAISSKFATSRKLLLLHQNTLVATDRYLYYRILVIEIFDAARSCSKLFFIYLPIPSRNNGVFLK